MTIKIIGVGKIKEKYFTQAIAEYTKRMSRHGGLEVIEVKDEQAPESLSEAEIAQIKEREGEKILQKIKEQDYVITLEILGEELTSEELAADIKDLQVHGKSSIAFVIGGSNGLGQNVLKRSNQSVSFGRMTLPHQLMRVVLSEQIYRATMINIGSPYHK